MSEWYRRKRAYHPNVKQARPTQNEPSDRPKIPPGEGERRAQRGLVPQYKIAAEKVLGLLSSGRLRALGLADPEADTLDDLQTVRAEGARNILDAYQVKWGAPGEVLTDGEFRGLLADTVSARRTVISSAEARATQGDVPVDRVIAHLYTNRVPSTSSLGKSPDGEALGGDARSLSSFLEKVWQPAQRGAVTTAKQVAAGWEPYLRVLADRCGLTPDELLSCAPDLRVEVGRELDEDVLDAEDWRTRERLQDLVEIRATLQDLVSHRDERWVRLSVDELVVQLGPDWSGRWRPRLAHEFPTAGPYEPVRPSVQALSTALEHYDSGYVVLTGSPGAGKSTLLTRTLRTDDRRAASFYAYLPAEGENVSRSEAAVFLHDLYLEVAGRSGRGGLAPREHALEDLRAALRDELDALGRRAARQGRPEIILVDGLDHVRRDPRPSHPLLAELPAPEQLPEGVLFVLGTRGLVDLPDHVRTSLEGTGRHIELEPLERAAVLRLCAQAGLEGLGERIAELSGGHPLLVRTYLGLASELPEERREQALADMPVSGGDIWAFYESVWDAIEREPEIVALLALVTRIRGPIRPAWLRETGPPPEGLVRLNALRHLFDTRDERGWRFFHASFREFLLRRTAEHAGQPDPAMHRAAHRELAERCRNSPSGTPERFDELHHLLEAGELDQVLERATVDYFRDQVDALRPLDEVAADLRMVARALAEHPDGLAAARLALAAHELQVRDYQFPETPELLELVVALGLPEIAVANLRAIDNGTVGHDRRVAAMRLAQVLDDAGSHGEAMRVFEQHEPLDWLGGPPSPLRDPTSGPRPGLWAWSRAAAQLRGSDYVLEMAGHLRAPTDLRPHEDPRLDDLPGELIWSAADELIGLDRAGEASVLRDALVACGDTAVELLARLDLTLALERPDSERAAALRALEVQALSEPGRITLAEAFAALDEVEAASAVLEHLRRPSLPDFAGRPEEERASWRTVYRYWRLQARLRGRPDAAQAVPEPERDFHRPAALGARHLVTVVGLEGRLQAGEPPAAAELLGAVRSMHAFWDSRPGHPADRWRAAAAVGVASERAVAVAAGLGESALRALQQLFVERWAERPATLRFDGVEMIGAFARHGAGPVTPRTSLERLEELLAADGAEPGDWVDVGAAWLVLEDADRAGRALRRAVRHTLSPSSDKDTQLTTWTRLMVPLLAGADGPALGDALVRALTELDRRGSGGSPELAARKLLDRVAVRDASEAWRLGQPLLEGRVLRTTEIVEALLEATARRPGPSWWTVAGELLVALGAGPPGDALERASRADAVLARARLPWLAERVAVEGRPTQRHAWRSAVVVAARAADVDETALRLDTVDQPREHEAARSQASHADDAPRQPPAAGELLTRAEDPDLPDYERSGAVRDAVGRLDELDPDQVAQLETIAQGTDADCEMHGRLARRALTSGDVDLAWQHALRALRGSRSTDWSRQWARGPALDAIAVLQQIDRPRARREIFQRFAELAEESEYFLSSVGGALDDYVGALELPEIDTAREALGVARALLRDIAPLPSPDVPRQSASVDEPEPEPDRAFDALIVHLLGFEQTVAWEAAQRALLGLRADGLGADVLSSALAAAPEAPLRACAVLATTGPIDSDDPSLVERLEALRRADRLDIRNAAALSLAALGREIPPPPAPVELPAALRLELPPLGDRPAPVDPLERALMGWRDAIEALAELAGVDEDALHADVLRRARVLVRAGADLGRTPSPDDTLGWGGLRPSARAIMTALAEVAAVLCDAGLAGERGALRAADLYPTLDVALLRSRPLRRPSAVPTFIDSAIRGELYRHRFEDLAAGAEGRIARGHDGWVVLGETTDLQLLDRQGHHELRRAGLVRDDDAPFGPAVLRPITMAEYTALGRSGKTSQGVVENPDRPAARAGWLALHPRLAGELGLSLAEPGGLDWLLNGQPAVRSLWWRSGFPRWQPSSDGDEVGEGWLVLGSPELVARLRDDGCRRSWRTWTMRRFAEDGDQERELRDEGCFELPAD